MATVTRTQNPLPFGDLEPKRFEDLVRQLAYEFKTWRRLEATGRAGGDSGFDARGYEIVDRAHLGAEQDTDEEDFADQAAADRLWLIQCKRENAIGPKALLTYLNEIVLTNEQLYGIVFAAACDFSKKSRDELAAWCRENGLSEWHIWGRSELEDMLFQPRFDHLLFAYFGISLRIRLRGTTTELRRQLAIKRKLKRFLDGTNDRLVLIRDIDDKHYPEMPLNNELPRFRVRMASSLSAYGFVVKISMRPAWLAANGEQWDVALGCYNPHGLHADQWNQPTAADEEISEKANSAWYSLPADEKAWLYLEGVLPYENIVLIDDVGDDEFDGPHVYVTGWDAGYPRSRAYIETIDSACRQKSFNLSDPDRESKFPEETRQVRRKWFGY